MRSYVLFFTISYSSSPQSKKKNRNADKQFVHIGNHQILINLRFRFVFITCLVPFSIPLLLLFPGSQHIFTSVTLWTSSSYSKDFCSFFFFSVVDFTSVSFIFSFLNSLLTYYISCAVLQLPSFYLNVYYLKIYILKSIIFRIIFITFVTTLRTCTSIEQIIFNHTFQTSLFITHTFANPEKNLALLKYIFLDSCFLVFLHFSCRSTGSVEKYFLRSWCIVLYLQWSFW